MSPFDPEESPLARTRRARRMARELAVIHPDAHCELDFTNAFELLVATVLSAQTTDKTVNKVTPTLFARYPDAVALGCDAFWNTFWNLNQYWNLVTPEWSSRWVKSQPWQ